MTQTIFSSHIKRNNNDLRTVEQMNRIIEGSKHKVIAILIMLNCEMTEKTWKFYICC